MNTAIGEFLHRFPVMMMGDFTLPFGLHSILFWMILFGGLGWTLFRNPRRGLFYTTLIPAFLMLLILTMGQYPQRNLESIYPGGIRLLRRIDRPLIDETLLRRQIGDEIRGLGSAEGRKKNTFGDELLRSGMKLKDNLGGDIGFEGGFENARVDDNRNQYK